MTRSLSMLVIAALMLPASVAAQQIPAPSGPVVFCGTQATPNADTYQMVFNGGAPEALAMDATTDAACPTGSTHSFRLPAARFTVGTHTVKVIATNAFGATDGPVYTVVVGIRPGQFTITAIVGGGQ
jgi:hypothetical protein